MKIIIVRLLLVLIILAVISLFIFEYFVNQIPLSKNWVRGCIIILFCIVGLFRTFTARRKNLAFYADMYPEIIKNSFDNQPLCKKKLLCAIRLYNENKHSKAIKYLIDVKNYAKTNEENYCVDLFAALIYTDIKIYDQAIKIYQNLISKDNADSLIFSNLGHVQMQIGEYENALRNYQRALDYDKRNAYAYNNIAWAYFNLYDFDNAIIYAQKTLEINPTLHQASSLLAVIYVLKDDKINSEKYFHIAISSGLNPNELKDTIEYYRTAQHALDEP